MTNVTIDRLGHHGDGIADGPIYAARALPGEVVSGVLNGDRLSEVRIVTPSEDRVKAPCRHYRACGGCQLQHASDEFVADWKQQTVVAALAAQGLSAPMRPIAVSPPASRRRATFSSRRTKKGALVGFHATQSDVITEIPDCQLLDPRLLVAVPVIDKLTVLGASRKGNLAVTVTASAAGLDIAVTGGKPLDGPLQMTLGQVAEPAGLARLSWDGDVVAMPNPPAQQFGVGRVVPPPGAFLQATTQGESVLVAAVREIVGDAAQVADLFAGCGTFSLPLAERAEILAVESDGDMMQALDQGWRQATGLKRVTTETRDLFRRPMQPDELKRFDAVVLDPPRAGAEAQVAVLTEALPPVIAYVSCNAQSFARDAAMLSEAGYQLEWVQVVDQFRWSVHTELVGSFRHAM